MKAQAAKTGLSHVVQEHLATYFNAHDDELPAPGLYKRILAEVEKPLLISVLGVVGGSQVKASKILGMSRNTLRKKIEEYNIGENAS